MVTTLNASSLAQLQQALKADICSISPLHGGCIGVVQKLLLSDGRSLVIKTSALQAAAPFTPTSAEEGLAGLELEAWMLETLAERTQLPVPKVLYKSPEALIMEFMPGESVFNPLAQTHAATLLAELHQVRGPRFGLERDTLIGGLRQPNPWSDSWLAFFSEHRILHMGRKAYEEGKISAGLLGRLEKFCDRIDQWLLEPAAPVLLHGDAWTTNILAKKGRITAFLDPAIYYGHPEVELAFTTLFGTFGEPFFKRYQEINPIEDGFFALRKNLYNLYPLLVHVRLFGGSYVSDVERTLAHIGC